MITEGHRHQLEQEQQQVLPVADLPPAERPRARLQRLGAEALSNPELLELVLHTCKREVVTGIGHRLLIAAGGSLRRLATECDSVLLRVNGIGPARLAQLDAMFEVARRWAIETPVDRPPIRKPQDIAAIYAPRLQDLPVEEFHVGALDTQFGLERDICLSRGTLNSTALHIREVFHCAVEARASALVLVHNHPSGDPTPSPEDHVRTIEIATAGRMLGIPIYDHVIIGRGRYVSFLEQQWI